MAWDKSKFVPHWNASEGVELYDHDGDYGRSPGPQGHYAYAARDSQMRPRVGEGGSPAQ